MKAASKSRVKNVLSIDLESWVHCFRDCLKDASFARTSAERRELDRGYVPEATNRILELLDEHRQTATFFVPGEIYEWYPETLEEIERRGHEVGYHTHHHTLLSSPGILERELASSASFLEDLRPIGFRAPMIHLNEDDLTVLEEWSFRYSSSTYDRREVYQRGGIDEIPVSTAPFPGRGEASDELPRNLTLGMLSRELPFGGAILLPVLGSLTSRLVEARNKRGMSASLYVHPWQLFRTPEIESLGYRLKLLVRNPLCLPYTRSALGPFVRLLRSHEFTSFRELHGSRWAA